MSSHDKPQELVSLLTAEWEPEFPLEKVAAINAGQAGAEITKLAKELYALRIQDNFSFDEFRSITKRSWIVHTSVEKRLVQLRGEQERLERYDQLMWNAFDEMTHFWKFDQKFVHVQKRLADILVGLKGLGKPPALYTDSQWQKNFQRLQEDLSDVAHYFVRDGVFRLDDSETHPAEPLCLYLYKRCKSYMHTLVNVDLIGNTKTKSSSTRTSIYLPTAI